MDHLRQIWKSDTARLLETMGGLYYGVVTSADPTTYRVRVTIQPSGVLSGWLPVLTCWAGPGWGIVTLPRIGGLVALMGQEHDLEHAVVLGAIYTDVTTPPTVTTLGQCSLVHASGSQINLNNDGSITIVSGNVMIGDGTFEKLCNQAFATMYNGHTHDGGPTPDQQAGSAQLTQNLTAS
jgi:phage baseplate assembly protein V